MTRIRFQGSLPHAGDSQPFWAPRRGPFEAPKGTFALASRCRKKRGDLDRILRHANACVVEGPHLRFGRTFASLDDGPCVAHSFTRRRGAARHVRDNRFRHVLRDERGRIFLPSPTTFPPAYNF